MDKQLKDKAIDFKGKLYVEVKERVKYFNDTYSKGSITTERLAVDGKEYFKATVCPDTDYPNRVFTGHSQASFADTGSFVNKTSATENAETSAVGRALAFMGIGVIDSIASVDEIHKANNEVKDIIREPTEDNKGLIVYCETCNAKMVNRSGINKDGKKWNGWFCPVNKEHPARWI
jgi:hypothetical protein